MNSYNFSSLTCRIYIKKYIHLAVCTALIVLFTFNCVAFDVVLYYPVWTGIATFGLYSYHHLSTNYDYNIRSLISTHPFISLSFAIIFLTGMLLTGFRTAQTMGFLFAVTLCFFYFFPVLRHKKLLRSNYLLKPLTIGVVFGLLTAFIPYSQAGYSWQESLFLALARSAFIAALSLLFDIGDLKEDIDTHTVTLVQKLGKKKTKYIATILIFLAATIEGYGAWIFLIDFHCFMALLITYFITCMLIFYSEEQRPDWYYLLLVDGMIGLPWFLSFI